MDDARLLAASSLLVPYGDTLPTEGKTPWDEVVEVARKKVDQYRPDSPNVLVVYSCSANCIDETVIPTAICNIDSRCRADPGDGLRKLNGILLVSGELNASRGLRRVYYFECGVCAVTMPREVRKMLRAIVS
jgi:hypothetical protein